MSRHHCNNFSGTRGISQKLNCHCAASTSLIIDNKNRNGTDKADTHTKVESFFAPCDYQTLPNTSEQQPNRANHRNMPSDTTKRCSLPRKIKNQRSWQVSGIFEVHNSQGKPQLVFDQPQSKANNRRTNGKDRLEVDHIYNHINLHLKSLTTSLGISPKNEA